MGRAHGEGLFAGCCKIEIYAPAPTRGMKGNPACCPQVLFAEMWLEVDPNSDGRLDMGEFGAFFKRLCGAPQTPPKPRPHTRWSVRTLGAEAPLGASQEGSLDLPPEHSTTLDNDINDLKLNNSPNLL